VILLDTNVVSEPMRSHPNPGVVAWLDSQVAETLYLSTIGLAELLLGIENLPSGKRRKALAASLDSQLIALFGERILSFDAHAAKLFPKLVMRARRRGYAISAADAQISAIAALHRLTVATRDVGPFEAAGVPTINPWAVAP
jgi:predicted nucleic acid-binding protein